MSSVRGVVRVVALACLTTALVGCAGTSAIRLDLGSAGRTINLHPKASATVSLDTTAWTFVAQPSGSPIAQTSQVVVQGPAGCQIFAMCGSVRVTIRALRPGRATVRATRQRCGELVLCSGADASYGVEINVVA